MYCSISYNIHPKHKLRELNLLFKIPDVLWYKMDLSNNICRCGYLSFNGVTILFRSRRKRVMPTNPPFFLILKLILMVEESFYNLQRPAKTKIIYCGFNRRVARPSSRYERVSERKRNSEWGYQMKLFLLELGNETLDMKQSYENLEGS